MNLDGIPACSSPTRSGMKGLILRASADDMRSVETINNKIKTDPNYENLVKDAKDYFEKEGLQLP